MFASRRRAFAPRLATVRALRLSRTVGELVLFSSARRERNKCHWNAKKINLADPKRRAAPEKPERLHLRRLPNGCQA